MEESKKLLEMKLYEKVLHISRDLRLSKEGKNKGIGFNYFNPDDINREITPLLIKYGVFIRFDLVLKQGSETIYTALASVIDIATDKQIDYQFDIKEAVVQRAQGAQATGATITYAKRYTYMNIFNIADNKDDPDETLGEKETVKVPAGEKRQAQETKKYLENKPMTMEQERIIVEWYNKDKVFLNDIVATTLGKKKIENYNDAVLVIKELNDATDKTE
jgi:hypothetical protein